MKKTLLFIVALAAVAVGCTKSEVVKAPGHNKEIKFATYVGKTPATKAMSGDLAYLQSFTSEQTPSFHVNAFIHTEVEKGDDGLFKIGSISMSDAYMDKDVWWVSNKSQLGIPEETNNLKVIFSEAPANQQPKLEGSYDGSTVPQYWSDAYSPRANWYATSEFTTTTAEDGTSTSAWGAWTINAITSENNANALGTWDYPGTVYWPDANSSRKLAFSAYSLNVKDDIKFETTADGVTVNTPYSAFTYTVPQSVAAQNDLLVTPLIPNQGISTTGDYTTVGLTFKHVLSRIGFSLIANRNDDGIEVAIKSVTLNGSFPSRGTVALQTLAPEIKALTGDEHTSYSLFESLDAGRYECCVWTSKIDRQPIYANTIYTPAVPNIDVTTGETTIIEKEKFEAKADADPSNRYMMLIPTALGEDAHILVTYQLTDADEQTAKISIADIKNFEAGKSYDFVFKVSTSAIGFYVEVSPWDSYFPTADGSTGVYTLTPEIVK